MKKFTPPEYCTSVYPHSVFLAGTIDLGKSDNWQSKAEELFEGANLNVFNPRRPNWDWNTPQSIDCETFYAQVKWEQDHLRRADYIIFNFLKDSKSPITLLEFGIMIATKPKACIVVCPEGFWRKGNIDIMCEIYKIKQAKTLEEAVAIVNKG
jgi:hypothetical protein